MATYQAQWAQYRRWGRIGIVAFAAIPALMAAIVLLTPSQVESVVATLGFGSFALLGLCFVYCLMRQQYFRCPRCERYFSKRHWWSSHSWRRSCVHCGLRLYAED